MVAPWRDRSPVNTFELPEVRKTERYLVDAEHRNRKCDPLGIVTINVFHDLFSVQRGIGVAGAAEEV